MITQMKTPMIKPRLPQRENVLSLPASMRWAIFLTGWCTLTLVGTLGLAAVLLPLV